MPVYQHASYGGETVTLQNDHLRVKVHKRLTGWGWAELFTPQGKCMGVLEHLGELMLRDQEIPMRLEAETHTSTLKITRVKRSLSTSSPLSSKTSSKEPRSRTGYIIRWTHIVWWARSA